MCGKPDFKRRRGGCSLESSSEQSTIISNLKLRGALTASVRIILLGAHLSNIARINIEI